MIARAVYMTKLMFLMLLKITFVLRSEAEGSGKLSCFYKRLNCDIPSIQGVKFPAKSIFFLETSCRRSLSSRQACSVESAARANPSWQINVLFTAPISKYCLKLRPFNRLNYPNIKFYRIFITKYGKGTPLELVLANARTVLNLSAWPVQHASNMLRFLTIYKWGGVYLDLDMIVVKSFDSLPNNWVARENGEHLGSGAFGASRDKIGREFMQIVLKKQLRFSPDEWLLYNGVDVLEEALQTMCSEKNIVMMSAIHCQGIEVFEQVYFNPVYLDDWKSYFVDTDDMNLSVEYTHHLWNKLSYNTIANKTSRLSRIARQFCPKVYSAHSRGPYFGPESDLLDVNSQKPSFTICMPKTKDRRHDLKSCTW